MYVYVHIFEVGGDQVWVRSGVRFGSLLGASPPKAPLDSGSLNHRAQYYRNPDIPPLPNTDQMGLSAQNKYHLRLN